MSAAPVFYNVEKLLPWLESGVPLITPTQRLARHIRYGWGRLQLDLGNLSWATPQVHSLAQWWMLCHKRRDPWEEQAANILSPHEELELWSLCVASNDAAEDLLRPRGAARQARDAYRNLLLWCCDWKSPSLRARFSYNPDTELFCELALQFEALCSERDLLLPEQTWLDLAADCPFEELVLVDYDDLSPLAERALNIQAGRLTRYSSVTESETRYIQPCSDEEQEFALAAQWAREKIDANPGARVGILVEDVVGKRLMIERCLREALLAGDTIDSELGVNFSAGTVLAQEHLVRVALDALSVALNQLTIEQVVTLLHSRHLFTDDEPTLQRALRKLQQAGEADMDAGRLRWHLQGTEFSAALMSIQSDGLTTGKRSPADWVSIFNEILERFGWPGAASLNSREYQLFAQWQQALEQFSRLSSVRGTLTFRDALQLLRQLCQDIVFQEQTEDGQLQVLGFLEAAGMEFDHLWISGMGYNQFPAAASPNPFLPVSLQKELRMPHADSAREYYFAQQMIDRFMGSAKSVTCSFVESEEGISLDPSPLLKGFIHLKQHERLMIPFSWQEDGQAELMIEPDDDQGPALSINEAASGGTGLLQDQSLCGFRAFVRRRLKVEPLPELSQGLTAADRGSLMHSALNHLWKELVDLENLLAQQTQWHGHIEQAIDLAIQEQRLLSRIDHRIVKLEKQRLQQLLLEWLEIESGRASFVVSARETEETLSLGDLKLNIRIDRIDRLSDGSEMVVDYKSGYVSPTNWLKQRPPEPQIPAYVLARGDRCSAGSYALLRSRELGFRGYGEHNAIKGVTDDISRGSDGRLTDWPSLVAHWQAGLLSLAEQYIQGIARVDPPDQNISCRYCGLNSVCRIAESGVADG